MKTFFTAVLIAAFALTGSYAFAHKFKTGDLVVYHPAMNATPPNAETAVGYLSIRNSGMKSDRLVNVSAPTISDSVEIHTMTMNGGAMQMRRISSVALPSGQEVMLTPSTIHLMFTKLKAPLVAGQKIPAVMTFEKSGSVNVEFNVEAIGTQPEKHSH